MERYGISFFNGTYFQALAPGAGLEPATNALTGRCSTIELSRNMLAPEGAYAHSSLNASRRKAAYVIKGRDIRIILIGISS